MLNDLKRVKGLFFDFDGTLVDSLPVLKQVYMNFLQKMGKKGSDEEFQRLNGPSISEIIHYLKETYHLEDSEESMKEMFHHLFLGIYSQQIDFFPGAVRFLKYAKSQGITLFVVTSANAKMVSTVFEKYQLKGILDGIISSHDLANGKPHPEVYLRALEKAGLKADDVAAFEDSENGIRAAEGAGIRTLAFGKLGAENWDRIMLRFSCDVIPIQSTFKVFLAEDKTPEYPADIRRQVDETWTKKTASIDWDLFDGKVFQLKELHPDHIVGTFNRYRYFYAQRQHPHLKESLQITLVCVTGVLSSDNRYLFAKRSKEVTQYPLKWEFAPSGGISIDYLTDHKVDFEKQLFDELSQEVGMDFDFVTGITPFLLIWDRSEMLVDICARIEVVPEGMATASYLSPEYIAYEWLTIDEIADFIKEHNVIPTTELIYDHLLEKSCF